jgi:hypothetical protein
MGLGPLAYISDNDVALTAIFFIFGMPMIAWLFIRHMKHRERVMTHVERVEMIRHGIDPGNATAVDSSPDLTNAKMRGAYAGHDVYNSPSAQAALQKGLVLAAIGLAITLGLSFIGYGPWLIGGFIPLFIGVAQVLIAMNAGASLRFGPPLPPRPPESPSPPPGTQSPHEGATYEGSYTYRPGVTQELRPPTPPPSER